MASYTYEFLELGEDVVLPCKCCRFNQGTDLPIPKKLSYEEIAQHAARFSKSIFVDWTKLNAIVKRFEPAIQKRWLKKNLDQKRSILLKAWPDIPKTHRPDFVGFRNVRKQAPRSRTLLSAAYLWPYINLEDLQGHNHLLMFLNSRGRNLPDLFLSADVEAAHLGRGWHLHMEEDLMSMQFFGQRSPRSYGKLGTKDDLGMIQRSDCRYHPALGLLGLEIQAGIYEFLLACAKHILHDVDASQYFLAPHQPMPLLPEPTKNEWPSLTAHTLQAPYGAPQQMDLNRLKTLVGARRAAAEDHVWMLREDPGYFLESLKDWKEHDAEMLKHACNTCWKTVAARMISDAFTSFQFWHHIYCLLDSMPSMDSQMRRADHTGLRLEWEEEEAWAELLIIIDFMFTVPISLLTSGLPPAPRMRGYYQWDRPLIQWNDNWATKRPLSNAERRVDLLFHGICCHEQRNLHSLNHLVQEVQYMIDTDSEAGQLVDSWLLTHFSDLAMLSELKMRIENLEPWASTWKAIGVHSSLPVQQSAHRLFSLDNKIRPAMAKGCINSKLLGDPTDGRFDYPATKRKNQANVKQMRYAEYCLDLFWVEIEKQVKVQCGISLDDVLDSRLLEPRELYRTPKWKETFLLPAPDTLKHETALSELDANAARLHPMSTIYDPVILLTPKTKTKTKGIAATPPVKEHLSTFTTGQEGTAAESTLLKIKVPKRAYKVLSALLPSSVESNERTEIAWDQLLQALNIIGLQPEKLYGSVWIFKPKSAGECKVEMKRSIQFHEPKEVRRGSKIPFHMVRTLGRRLKHAYGWEGGMFERE